MQLRFEGASIRARRLDCGGHTTTSLSPPQAQAHTTTDQRRSRHAPPQTAIRPVCHTAHGGDSYGAL